MEKVNVTISLKKEDKMQMDEMLDDIGLSFSACMNMFVKQSIRDRKIPLSLDLRDDPKQILKDMKSGRNMSKSYDNLKDLWEDLLTDE